MSKKNRRTPLAASRLAAARTADFNPDYSINKRDLRRTAVLWAILVTILIVLGIFQDQILSLVLK